MDDNKEKLTGGRPGENGTPENTPPGNDGYHDEMEELARIFKEELDKAVQDAEDAADVASARTIQVEGYQPDTLSRDAAVKRTKLCECCGERPCGTEADPDSPYCEQCKTVLEKYPYDWKGILAAIAVIGLALAAVFCFMLSTPLFSYMKEGDAAVKKGELYSAMTKYDLATNYLPEEGGENFLGLFAKRIELDYRLLNLSLAASEREQYFSDGDLKLPAFRHIKELSEEITLMQVTASAIQRHIDEKYATVTEKNYDEAIAMLDYLSGKRIYEKKDGTLTDELDTEYKPDGTEKVYIYDEGWLNIYKYSIAQVCGKEDEIRIGFLEKAGTYSDYLDITVSSMLAAAYINTEDYAKAEELAEKIRLNNSQDEDYYMITSMLSRYRDKDYKKAAQICDNGLNMLSELPDSDIILPQVGYVLYMQKALSLTMQEDYKGAYAAAKTAYDDLKQQSALTVEVRDLYAMLALAAGDNEAFKAIEDEIKQYASEGIDFSEDVKNYREGKATLQEIAESGRYDLI